MRKPQRGDGVLHIYHDTWPDGKADSRLCGHSAVARSCREVQNEPSSPGDWRGMAPYYRIDLEDYTAFPSPLPMSTIVDRYGEEIRQDLRETRPRFYPFNTHGDSLRTVQGIYLAKTTEGLLQILMRGLRLEETSADATDADIDPHYEYAEGRRLASERYFFSRNPRLVRLAKERSKGICQVCGFDFAAVYGKLGEGYCEVHHLNPLSERSDQDWDEGLTTSLEDVVVLCANCHRMVHRQRPALSLDVLRSRFSR